jgi:uncharacterized membrane protein YkoI
MQKSSQNKKAITAGILAVTMSIAAIFVMQSASAQTNNQTSTEIPDLNGSVSIDNATNEFVQENLQVPFNTAAQTALGEVDDGTVISSRLSAVQGYLTYVFKVANYDAGTYKVVIIDAGNGDALYTSEDLTLRNGGLGGGCGHHGGFGHGSWMGKGSTSESSESSDVEATSA